MDTYDEQIDALLAEDYERFAGILGIELENISHHYGAWRSTGFCKNSLFAFLPGVNCCCATMVDHDDYKPIGDRLFGQDRMILPDIIHNQGHKFTRVELEEIARRQRLVRQPEPARTAHDDIEQTCASIARTAAGMGGGDE